MRDELTQALNGGGRWLAELFGRSELFVDRKGFNAWLVQANLKAAALTSPDALQAAMTAYAGRPTAPTMVADVAVIEICGPVTYKSSWYSYYFGGANIQDLQQQLRTALADPAVKTILFRIDSPGGVIDMVPEFADEIFAARGKKPMVVVADTLVASAAYWLASQADTIFASASAQLGSIGVYCEHDDISGMLERVGVKVTLIAHGDNKVAGNEYEPLSDAARADLQARVDEIGDWFDTAVARGRGVKKTVVLESFGQGKVFRGKQAIALGLADKAGTFSQVLAKLTKGRPGTMGVAAAAAGDRPTEARADSDDDESDDETPDVVAPDADGGCPDGYVKGDDGQCHLAADEDEPTDDAAAAEADALNAIRTAGE